MSKTGLVLCGVLLGGGALGGCGDSGESGTTSAGGSQSGGASGQSGDAGSKAGGGSNAGGTSGQSGDAGGQAGGGSSAGGTSGAGGAADSGSCAALERDLQAKLEEAAQCYAGTPNPSSCEIIDDGLCGCAPVQLGHSSSYLEAAKNFKAAGCTLRCPSLPCAQRAVCQPITPGSTQGRCVPAT